MCIYINIYILYYTNTLYTHTYIYYTHTHTYYITNTENEKSQTCPEDNLPQLLLWEYQSCGPETRTVSWTHQ